MSGGRVVPGPFRGKVRAHLLRLGLAHPRVVVDPADAVQLAGDRVAGRGRGTWGSPRGGTVRCHGGQPTARPTRVGRAVAGVVAAGLVATSVGVGATASAAAAGGTDETEDGPVVFTVGMLGEVDSFSPFLGIVAESYEMWALMYDYMITYSMDDMSPEPGLATSWETSDDGLTWTFDIRTGVTFSDGEPLTAEDIAYTYNRILDGGPDASTWSSYLRGVESVTAPDDETVVLELPEPNAVLPLLPIPIVPEHVWSDVSEEESKSYPNEPTDGEPPVGSGPFRLVEGTVGGSTIRFEATPDYWQGAPHVDEVVFRSYQEEDPMVQSLVKGETDFLSGVSPLSIRSLQQEDGITTQEGISGGFDEIAFNVGAVDTKTGEPIGDGNPALQDLAFRQALGWAIDRDVIVEKAYQGAGVPAYTIIPETYSTWHWAPPEDETYTFDLERAADLLDEAGYAVGSDGLRTMPDGSPMDPLRLYARAGSSTSVDTIEFFAEWLDEIDVPNEVETLSEGKITELVIEGEYDAFQWGWYVEPDPSSMLAFLTCDQLGGWNDAWWCNKEYDRLFDAQRSELDQKRRVEMVQQMQQIFYDDAAYHVTVVSETGEAYRSDRFACFDPQPTDGGILLFQYGIHNYLSVRPAAEAGDCDGTLSTDEAAEVAQGAVSSSARSAIDTVGVLGMLVGGLLLFVAGSALGAFAGYRKATVDYRE